MITSIADISIIYRAAVKQLHDGVYVYILIHNVWLCHLCGELWYHTRAEGFT
jgi:hypothetical protein